MDIQKIKKQLTIKNCMREKILIKHWNMKLRKSPRKWSKMLKDLKQKKGDKKFRRLIQQVQYLKNRNSIEKKKKKKVKK